MLRQIDPKPSTALSPAKLYLEDILFPCLLLTFVSPLLQILAEWNVHSIRLFLLFPVWRFNCVRPRRACPTCLRRLVVKHDKGASQACCLGARKPLVTVGS